MTIVFICGSLEKGKDGVGDYTRELAVSLVKTLQVRVTIVALNDSYVNKISHEKQLAQSIEIPALRLPIELSHKEKINLLHHHVTRIKPDIISLQFVPYAFDKKGTPYKLCDWLSKLPTKNWHIMFHELWIGMEKKDSFKLKLIGSLQKHIIKKLLRRLKPKHIHTSNRLYFYHLTNLFNEDRVSILPLFSNISYEAFKKKNCFQSNTFNIILFGTLHHSAPIKNFLSWLLEQLKAKETTPCFTFIGNNGRYLIEWTNELDKQNISYQNLSFQTEENIALILQNAQLGITTTPYFLSDKSGAVAAMIRYQLPILNVARNWTPNIPKNVLKDLKAMNCMKWDNNIQLEKVLTHKPTFISLKEISNLLYKKLK